MDSALIGGLILIGLVWGLADWLRRKLREDDSYDKDLRSILHSWNRAGPGPGPCEGSRQTSWALPRLLIGSGCGWD